MWGIRWMVWWCTFAAVTACGDPPPSGGGDVGACEGRTDCDDGVFCNGAEGCDSSSPAADSRGCVPGAPPCGVDRCNETAGTCAECEDVDGDGHGSPDCGGDDCDDSDPTRFPGAREICNDVDEDCDPSTVGDRDLDADGAISAACCNGDACGGDCNDGDPAVQPGGTETCDGVDQDCDGVLDEGVATSVFGRDDDRDGFGRADDTVEGCVPPPGYAPNTDDCNDEEPSQNPSAPEVCDRLDNDCDGATDEGDLGLISYADMDGDGFGDPATGRMEGMCGGMVPPGRVLSSTDCDDTNPLINTGAEELCNGVDDDCDGAFDGPGEDDDDDGSADATCGGDDCDDDNDAIQPGAPEICDGLNNDCSVDHDPEDGDGDGVVAVGTGCVGGPLDAAARDCDDADPDIYPGAPETCDTIDSDCDGAPDNGPFAPCALWCDAGECVEPTTVRAAGATTCITTERIAGGDGPTLCVGANDSGQRGNGTTTGGSALTAVDGPRFQSIAMGGRGMEGTVCGWRIGTGRGVWCWGNNADGQIPGATESEVLRPVRVSGFDECRPGGSFLCCVEDRVLTCTGDDSLQQIAGSGLEVPLRSDDYGMGADHACVSVSSPGGLACWGRNDDGQTQAAPSPSAGVVRSAGMDNPSSSASHSCALDGRRLMCWGANESGQSTGTPGPASPTPVEVLEARGTPGLGDGFTCARHAGTGMRDFVGCFGRNDRSQLGTTAAGPVSAADIEYIDLGGSVQRVVAGDAHACAILVDHSVVCWGDDAAGQLGPRGDGTPSATPVALLPAE